MKEIMDRSEEHTSELQSSHEIVEKNKGVENLVIVGIKTRGEFIARRMVELINQFENCDIELGVLDINPWRDDTLKSSSEIVSLGVDVKDKIVVLVDDVLYKGRTVRAAMDGILHFGRAKEIHLAVLIDRGHRELPIRADYVGKNIPTSDKEDIRVKMVEFDDQDLVVLLSEND